jgi:hypothetical protein
LLSPVTSETKFCINTHLFSQQDGRHRLASARNSLHKLAFLIFQLLQQKGIILLNLFGPNQLGPFGFTLSNQLT